MRWSGATGAIARCKRVSTGCGRKRRSVRAWRWICGVKPKPKAGNKPLHHFILHELDKPGSSATVVYLAAADKYRGLTRRPSQGQKGIDERTLMTAQRPFHPW